jgi:hypothetical protein
MTDLAIDSSNGARVTTEVADPTVGSSLNNISQYLEDVDRRTKPKPKYYSETRRDFYGANPEDPRVNHFKDWNQLQGFRQAGDAYFQPRRDLNHRHITIENSGERKVLVVITTDFDPDRIFPRKRLEDRPGTGVLDALIRKSDTGKYLLRPHEIIDVAVNEYSGPMQYLWPTDPNNFRQIGHPRELMHNAQSFVLREGLNGWSIHGYLKSYH